jgi:hypothetical protein
MYNSQIQSFPQNVEYNQGSVRMENAPHQNIDHDQSLIRNSMCPPNSNISSFQLPFTQGNMKLGLVSFLKKDF